MLGNNFSTAVLNSGAVYLSKDTRNWTIVGGNIKEQVIDRGIDNIITGMNVSTSETPLGYSVSAKLSKINQLMK